MSSSITRGRAGLLFGVGVLAGFTLAGIGVATGKIYHRDDVILGFFPPKSTDENRRPAG